MRTRFWIGILAVVVIAAGSVVAAVAVYVNDHGDFERVQSDEALRAAHQTEAVAGLSVGELSSAAAFFRAAGGLNEHQFSIIGHSLLRQGVLNAAAFIPRVTAAERARYERDHQVEIVERGPDGLRRARPRRAYFPITYVTTRAGPVRSVGFDVGSDPERSPFLHRARDGNQAVATPLVQLLLGGSGINVFRAVYRDRAPLATVAERRRALIGFAAGSFRVADLAKTAMATLPRDVAIQLRIGRKAAAGDPGPLEDAASARIAIADRTWLLVVKDPGVPSLSLPLVLAVMGIALAALLASLILSWSRSERIRELELEASHDSLTGLHNRRRFVEDLRAAIARARREARTGALLMIDLDDFKQVNDTHGHPAGDRLLEEISTVLRQRTREGDSLARFGGDEFAVILPRASQEEAIVAGRSIAAAIRSHRPHSGVDPVTVSVGVAMFGAGLPPRPGTVVSEADMAMYAAKEGGRDGVRIFDHAAMRDRAPDARS
jgi:diguanylate cyclase (GGDEF)-like protein